jgi:hypothetical protein
VEIQVGTFKGIRYIQPGLVGKALPVKANSISAFFSIIYGLSGVQGSEICSSSSIFPQLPGKQRKPLSDFVFPCSSLRHHPASERELFHWRRKNASWRWGKACDFGVRPAAKGGADEILIRFIS